MKLLFLVDLMVVWVVVVWVVVVVVVVWVVMVSDFFLVVNAVPNADRLQELGLVDDPVADDVCLWHDESQVIWRGHFDIPHNSKFATCKCLQDFIAAEK
jgi:hypothetical protein